MKKLSKTIAITMVLALLFISCKATHPVARYEKEHKDLTFKGYKKNK